MTTAAQTINGYSPLRWADRSDIASRTEANRERTASAKKIERERRRPSLMQSAVERAICHYPHGKAKEYRRPFVVLVVGAGLAVCA